MWRDDLCPVFLSMELLKWFHNFFFTVKIDDKITLPESRFKFNWSPPFINLILESTTWMFSNIYFLTSIFFIRKIAIGNLNCVKMTKYGFSKSFAFLIVTLWFFSTYIPLCKDSYRFCLNTRKYKTEKMQCDLAICFS